LIFDWGFTAQWPDNVRPGLIGGSDQPSTGGAQAALGQKNALALISRRNNGNNEAGQAVI
jgi:hypothetical protein